MPILHKGDFNLIRNPAKIFKNLNKVSEHARLYMHLEEIFFYQAYGWLYQRIKPNTLMIDIGGFFGDTAIYFAMNLNVKEVRVFEPHPRNFQDLKENIKYSKFRNIRAYNSAVSNSRGFAEMTYKYRSDYNSIKESGGGVPVVPLNTILKLAENDGYEDIAIKCDCEGTEYKIFDGSANLSRVYAIMLEYHKGSKRMPSIFRSKGFNVRVDGGSKKVGYMRVWKE